MRQRWIVPVFALALLFVSQLAMAQFNAIVVQAPPASALTTTCEGSTPIPDGALIKIFLDADSDGPDMDDPQPTVCTDPPDCQVPFGAVNFNEFTMNGVALAIGTGYFGTEPPFSCTTTIPGTGRFYLRVYEPDNTTVLWTSTVFTVQTGLQEIYFSDIDWTCGSTGPQCTVIDESE
ncbi:MAG: hypothetical protein KDB65_13645 [Calditrichaeota bacterium]|nr:hypothetical protein [Calditrichota bacterium]